MVAKKEQKQDLTKLFIVAVVLVYVTTGSVNKDEYISVQLLCIHVKFICWLVLYMRSRNDISQNLQWVWAVLTCNNGGRCCFRESF